MGYAFDSFYVQNFFDVESVEITHGMAANKTKRGEPRQEKKSLTVNCVCCVCVFCSE
jgi:hypothetical protein